MSILQQKHYDCMNKNSSKFGIRICVGPCRFSLSPKP